MSLKSVIRAGVNRLGLDVVRLSRSPKRTLLGLSQQNIGTIIDVGANEGQFARMILGRFPKAELYCFEPCLSGCHRHLQSRHFAALYDGVERRVLWMVRTPRLAGDNRVTRRLGTLRCIVSAR